jgi:hypothetical protein
MAMIAISRYALFVFGAAPLSLLRRGRVLMPQPDPSAHKFEDASWILVVSPYAISS